MYRVTRQQVIDAMMSLRGVRFRHQGRSRETGVDCMGMLSVALTDLKYPVIIDVEAYRQSPPASIIYKTLCANFDEIPLSEVGLGDIYLMRLRGRKAKHASVLVNDKTDVFEGIEPQIIHAHGLDNAGRVTVDALVDWLPWCVTGFRLKGLVD